jgi:hypothetical protein
MARNFGIRSRVRAPRISPEAQRKIEAALSHENTLRHIDAALSRENQERAFRTAEALQHVADPWARADAKLDKAIRLADAIWAKNDRDWYKLLALQLGLVAVMFIALVLALR